MIRKYDNHKLQTSPWYREEEPHNTHETPGRQTKQSNQLSLPHQDDCRASNAQQNVEQLQNPTMFRRSFYKNLQNSASHDLVDQFLCNFVSSTRESCSNDNPMLT